MHAGEADKEAVVIVTVSHVLGRLGVRMGQNWSPMVPIGKGKVKGVK